MPHRLLPRKMTTPTARVIASIWITVALVSGLVIHSSIHEADCSKQFRAALIARSDANDAADEFEERQDEAQLQWLKDIGNPPPELGNNWGPERLAWLQEVNANGAARVQQLIDNRRAALAERRAHPLPELTCGK